MRFTADTERAAFHHLQQSPDAPLLYPNERHRHDGSLLIYRDGLCFVLVRYLYERFVGELGRGDFLHRSDGPWGDQNPFHYVVSPIANPALVEHCRNGHMLTPQFRRSGFRCELCYDAYLAKQRMGGWDAADINRARLFCPQGHSLNDEANIYWGKPDSAGQAPKRNCRACALERAAARRELDQRAHRRTLPINLLDQTV